MKESGLRENCTIRLTERTEEGANRPPSTLHVSTGRRKAEGPNRKERGNRCVREKNKDSRISRKGAASREKR